MQVCNQEHIYFTLTSNISMIPLGDPVLYRTVITVHGMSLWRLYRSHIF